MPTNGIKVIEWHGDSYGVSVYFSDGHKAQFEAYAQEWGYSIEGLRSFSLFRGDQRVFHYNGRLHREGPMEDEKKVTFIAGGYTQERAASYWRIAKNHYHTEYFEKEPHPENLWWPWRIICVEGGFYLEDLEKGKAKVLIS